MDVSGAALPEEVDVAIVGAGFSGIAMAVRLRRAGRPDFLVLERSGSVGGTWRDNTYPGCACDVPSHLYSLAFAPNPDWSSTYSPQAEIWAYLERVAREQGVMPHVHFNCELRGASWDQTLQRWRLDTSKGAVVARVLVPAAGPLSAPSIPNLPGLETFQGTVFHSARWQHGHDLRGERVAVVGTVASAIQFVPEIQPKVGRLVLFQRTPAWIMPHRVRPLSDLERRLYRRVPALQRLVRRAIASVRELYAIPILRAGLQPYTRRLGLQLLERQVADPWLRRKLTPEYAPGCKRILLSRRFYPAIQRPNVELVTEAVREVRPHSVVSASGAEHEVDTIIFATGFHVTDSPMSKLVRGIDGHTLDETWAGSPQAHRGTTVSGFPNLFLLLGPNTGLGHTSVVLMAEAQAGYVLGALREMDRRHVQALNVRPEAQAAWNARVQQAMKGTVWTAGGCASWYLDRNGLNTALWPGFAFGYTRLMGRFDSRSYDPPPTLPGGIGMPTRAGATA
jgi:cation diffusion facilitator CzcD-associated flavoprotein CzcO